MAKIIDLSQMIYVGMPVYKKLPQYNMKVHLNHEDWQDKPNSGTATPSVHQITMSEHTGTHVDAINHMGISYAKQSIDTMPLTKFYTDGICLDFRNKGLKELITSSEIIAELARNNLVIHENDTVLICTDHYINHYDTQQWPNGPGLTAEAAEWLGLQKIAAFGVETMSPGVSGVSNRQVHEICGALNFTHYENLINLNQLLGVGRFKFIGLPLKIKGGTGSPVRAVAIIE